MHFQNWGREVVVPPLCLSLEMDGAPMSEQGDRPAPGLFFFLHLFALCEPLLGNSSDTCLIHPCLMSVFVLILCLDS